MLILDLRTRPPIQPFPYNPRELSAANFYSFLMDGSTDSGNVEDELAIENGKGHFEFVSVIRGHHLYKFIWRPQLGEKLFLAL